MVIGRTHFLLQFDFLEDVSSQKNRKRGLKFIEQEEVWQQLVTSDSDNMCTGKCSRFIAFTLYPLMLLSIICNIILFFPGWDVKYAKEGHITTEVTYMGGVIGGGLLVSCVLSCV